MAKTGPKGPMGKTLLKHKPTFMDIEEVAHIIKGFHKKTNKKNVTEMLNSLKGQLDKLLKDPKSRAEIKRNSVAKPKNGKAPSSTNLMKGLGL